MRTKTWTTLGLAALLLLTVGADAIRAEEPGNLEAIGERAHGIWNADGRVLGLGPGYRVEFHPDGISFVPALGRVAERLWPLTFRLESVRRGGTVLYLADASSTREVDGRLVRYRHAFDDFSMIERYEVTADGVEQSFHFDRLPAGSGDLVVTGRIETDLAAAPRNGGGLAFEAPGAGGVHFGAVTGIEAEGGRITGSLRLDHDRLELVLPGAFVDRAALPLVLDPLIGAIILFTSDGRSPDAAYDVTNDRYLVVFQEWFTFGINEIRGIALDPDGPLTTLVLLGSGATLDPRVANVNGRDRFLVCWQHGDSVFGPFRVRCASVDASTLQVSSYVEVAGDQGWEISPDVAGDDSPSSDSALVVWDDESVGIRRAKVTLPPTGAPQVSGLSFSSGDYGHPAISSHPGASNRYLLVYERVSPINQSKDVVAAALDENGTTIATLLIASASDLDETAPAVDGDGDQWCVAYQRQESPSSAKHDVYCRTVSFDPGLGLLVAGPETVVKAVLLDDEIQPSVAWLGVKYAIFWSDQNGAAPLEYSLLLLEVSLDCSACSPKTTVEPVGRNIRSQVASELSSGGTSDRGLLVFEDAQTTPPFLSDVRATYVEAIGPGGAVTVLGGGCGVSGTLSTSGVAALGSGDFSLALTGGDPSVPTALLNLNVVSSPIPCASCQITPIQFLLTTPMVGGQVLVPLPIPCDPLLYDLTVETQLIMQNTSATPCYQVGLGVSFSDRLRFTIGS